MEEAKDQNLPQLKSIRLERNKLKKVRIKHEKATAYIFTPKNDLEEAAIAVATEGSAGWKDSLYSLDYVDRYLEHTCFIFATRPKESKDQQWVLVNLDGRYGSKYWIALGEKELSDVYLAWAKVVQKPNPQFDPQRMINVYKPE